MVMKAKFPVSFTSAILAGFGLAASSLFAQVTPGKPVTIIYVANAENQTGQNVRYTGKPWKTNQAGFLEGVSRGHRLLGNLAPGEGDFWAAFDLSLGLGGRESQVVVDGSSEIVLSAAPAPWKLRGRFFRVGDQDVAVKAPPLKTGQQFNLTLERRGEEIGLSVDGQEIYRGPCGAQALSSLGLDPGSGEVQLYTFTASGSFPDAGLPVKLFNNSFGMQLRAPPARADLVREPVIVREAPTNECSLVARRDGALEVYYVTKPESDSISMIRSDDGGLTWSAPVIAFTIPGRAYYAVKMIEAADGALHGVFHILGQGAGGYRGRLYEVYHVRKPVGAAAWTEAMRIVPGYVGSIRGFTQLKSGRLVLGVYQPMPGREEAPETGPDYGVFDTTVYLSDDKGGTWRKSPDELRLELVGRNATRYGAVEAVLLELKDRVWMLVRDRGGRLWQSFSLDGERWSPLERSAFISSDSPAELLRLRDGRIVLFTNACQNWTDSRSYAMGGREVLQASISADDGVTWSGFREVLHETNLIGGGDRGSAYPSATETVDGKIAFVSGQGAGKHAIALFDPSWLTQKITRDDLSAGPTGWTQYGDEGLKVVKQPDGSLAVAIPLKSSGLCGASWNFPMANAGVLRLRLQTPEKVHSVHLSLNDHFVRADDAKAAEHCVYDVVLPEQSGAETGQWRDLRLAWNDARQGGSLSLEIDGVKIGTSKAQRNAQFGVNYLRIEFRADSNQGDLLLTDVTAAHEQ